MTNSRFITSTNAVIMNEFLLKSGGEKIMEFLSKTAVVYDVKTKVEKT